MLTKRTEVDEIQLVGPFRQLRARVARIIERDGVEVSRSHSYELLSPDEDVSDRSPFVRAVANATWTPAVVDAWNNRPPEPGEPGEPGRPPEPPRLRSTVE